MKTITLKADDEFDALLARLAARSHSTRSAVIREAVRRYEKALEREALADQVLEASRRTRSQYRRESRQLDAATDDGL